MLFRFSGWSHCGLVFSQGIKLWKQCWKQQKRFSFLLSFLDCIGTSVSFIKCDIFSNLLCRSNPTSSYRWFIKLLRDLGAPKMLKGQLTSRYMYHFIFFFCRLKEQCSSGILGCKGAGILISQKYHVGMFQKSAHNHVCSIHKVKYSCNKSAWNSSYMAETKYLIWFYDDFKKNCSIIDFLQ